MNNKSVGINVFDVMCKTLASVVMCRKIDIKKDNKMYNLQFLTYTYMRFFCVYTCVYILHS